MKTTSYTFEEVSITATKYWKDENGKRRQKTKKFYQTINPFNKDSNGNIKNRSQIIKEINEERKKWLDNGENS